MKKIASILYCICVLIMPTPLTHTSQIPYTTPLNEPKPQEDSFKAEKNFQIITIKNNSDESTRIITWYQPILHEPLRTTTLAPHNTYKISKYQENKRNKPLQNLIIHGCTFGSEKLAKISRITIDSTGKLHIHTRTRTSRNNDNSLHKKQEMHPEKSSNKTTLLKKDLL